MCFFCLHVLLRLRCYTGSCVTPKTLIVLLLSLATSECTGVTACAAAEWHTVFTLDPEVGCPGEWLQALPEAGLGDATPPEAVCSRGASGMAQVSAIVADGWTYSQIRGTVKSYVMGSPDGMREEPWRGPWTIDDAYLDGVALSRWTTGGRVHVASYAAGVSYTARHFSFYETANCACHGGASLSPDWLGEDYYCDSTLRGGPGCAIGHEEPAAGGCQSSEDCASRGCNASFYELSSFYTSSGVSTIFDANSSGYLCRGSRYARPEDFPDRPFGAFAHAVPDGAWANDPIEARIMAGQAASIDSSAGWVWGNEEVAVRSLQVEVRLLFQTS